MTQEHRTLRVLCWEFESWRGYNRLFRGGAMVKIDSVKWGEVKVDGRTYYSDVCVSWNGKVEMWTKSHTFDMDELVKALKKDPDIIVLGTGHEGIVNVPEEVLETAENKEVKLIIEPSLNAAEIFNALAKDRKRVIAVIHSTC